MGEVYESGSRGSLNDFNALMEEGESSSMIIKQENHKSETDLVRCLVCKEEEEFEGEHLDIMVVSTTTSDNTAAYVIATMMMKRPSEDDITFTNTSICKACFDLLDRADELQVTLEKVKEELGGIKDKFRNSLNVATKDPPKPPPKPEPLPPKATAITPKRSPRNKKPRLAKEVKPISIEIEQLEVEPDDLSLWDLEEDEEEEEEDDDDDDDDYTPTPRVVYKAPKEKVPEPSLPEDTGDGFECPECGTHFQQKALFDSHMRNVHILPSMPKCKVCSRHFRTEKELTRHMKRSHSKVVLTETGEDTTVSSSQQSSEGVPPNVVTEDAFLYFLNPHSQLKCKFCNDKLFYSREEFCRHFEDEHSTSSSIKCKLCSGHLASGINDYLLHMCVSHPSMEFSQGTATVHVIANKEMYNCEDPNEQVKVEYNTTKKKPSFPCVVCPLVLPDLDTLMKHRRRLHRKEFFPMSCHSNVKYYCPLCNASVSFRRMKLHFNDYHTMAETVTCDVCNEKFNKHFLLRTHRSIYHAIGRAKKKHACTLCLKMFCHPAELKRHIITAHEEQRNFVCDICGRSFKWKSGLMGHRLHHEGNEKKSKCKICHKSYAFNFIRKHIRRVHKIYDAPRLNDPFRSHLVPYEKLE